MKNLLIVRPGAVGDGLLLAPTLACVRRAHPSARIEIAGRIWRLRLLVGPTLADVVTPIEHFFDEGRAHANELLRFDRIVVFAIELDSAMVREIVSAAPDRVERHLSFPICRTSEIHVIDHIQEALSGLGIEKQADHQYCLPIPASARRFAEEFLAKVPGGGRPRVYVQPGTKIATKRWPAERFIELCRELARALGHQVFLGCGPLDEETVKPIKEGLEAVGFVSVGGQDLERIAGILAQMDLYIGVDSGITHLAALVGTPTIAIFGPTRPQLWGPVGPSVRVLTGSRGLDCCVHDHPRVCEGGCMNEVSVESVLRAVAELMGGKRE